MGTAITTLVKKPASPTPPDQTPLHIRDFWGDAEGKRRALVDSLGMEGWNPKQRAEASQTPRGPRVYEDFTTSADQRWKLLPYEAVGGYEEWPSLDELFGVYIQGVNPNRGLVGSVIDGDAEVLSERMADYLDDTQTFAAVTTRYPELGKTRAGYDPENSRAALLRVGGFENRRLQQYVLFPLDGRHIYYETRGGLLNRARPELWDNLDGNAFLLAVPQPRRPSEARLLLSSCAFDLHVHDRGSVGFPVHVRSDVTSDGFFAVAESDLEPKANLRNAVMKACGSAWGVQDLDNQNSAIGLTRRVMHAILAATSSPQYQDDHREHLLHGEWARVPLPKDKDVFDDLVSAGELLAILLDPFKEARDAVEAVLGSATAANLAVLSREGGGTVRQGELVVEVSYYGAAKGRWRQRPAAEAEPMHAAWGDSSGDLYINKEICFKHVPRAVWEFELGGYPVVKKWLGYRHSRFRDGSPLSLREKDQLRQMVQRLAAVLALGSRLDELYARAAADAFTVDDLE